MDTVHRADVTPDQIDHLGHMNVRYYSAHARAGASALLDSFGLRSDGRDALVQCDTYVRHHREQFVGAPLEVRGGVLDASPDRIRLYEELVNSDTDDVAATFVLGFELADPSTRARVSFDTAVVESALAAIVEVPDHGRPRTISIDEDVSVGGPSLAVLRERDLAQRQVRTILDEECDEEGYVLPLAVAELVWGGDPLPGREFRPLEELPGGGQMGFATMETRATWARPVRVGSRLQSFGAELEMHAKTMYSRNWLVDVDLGDLVGVFSVVNVAFDTGARRAIEIPEQTRARLAARFHPDLRGTVDVGESLHD